jgi:hypothetical protein
VTPKIEQLRARALLEALRAEAEGPTFSSRVRIRQEALLAARERGQWVEIEPQVLGELVARLDGPRSASRHLGIAPTTLARWAAAGRIRRWALHRLEELIATGAPSLRRPNRDRNYLREEGIDGP